MDIIIKPAPDAPISLTMTLTIREAKVLRTVLRNVGGHTRGPRGLIDEISMALADAGVGCYKNATSGSTYFLNKHNGWKGLD